MKARGVHFTPFQSRKHNKVCVVERNNCVIKDALENLDKDARHEKSNIRNKIGLAQFSSNILYVGSMFSAFEEVRGYTPVLEGTKSCPVPKDILDSHKEMEFRRLLARILKSMPVRHQGLDVKIGDKV